MSLPKGDIIYFETDILFGKYEILRCLGKGSFSEVYLARHQSLESLCAIKVVPKQSAYRLILLSEAHLMKSFQHEGIPKIYDFEEDNDYIYLIEEYIHGLRLDEMLLQQSHISMSSFINISTQICNIFSYLHNQVPFPVVYLDLKPEHIYLCKDQLKLIDYGAATLLSNSATEFRTFGNELFTPPELKKGMPPSIASDIYCIGQLLRYLSSFLSETVPKEILELITKSTNEDPLSRFETVREMESILQHLQKNYGKTLLSQHIAVVGCHSGCGATHIAITLTCTLNANGYKAYYHEKNLGNALLHALKFMKAEEQEGCYHFPFFHGYPLYGPGVSIECEKNAFHIYDFGHSFSLEELARYDCILFICDNAIWHRKSALEKGQSLLAFKDRLRIIGNQCNRSTAIFYAKEFSLPICLYPEDSDSFRVDKTKSEFLFQVLNMKGRRRKFFPEKIKLLKPAKS